MIIVADLDGFRKIININIHDLHQVINVALHPRPKINYSEGDTIKPDDIHSYIYQLTFKGEYVHNHPIFSL